MKIEQLFRQGVNIALINSPDLLISDSQSALDLAMSAKYSANAERIVLAKHNICEDFFVLSSGLAGEILQKFINYQIKVAIYGDYAHYTSKPLHDFIYESNQGQNVFFVSSQEEAIEKLAQAQ